MICVIPFRNRWVDCDAPAAGSIPSALRVCLSSRDRSPELSGTTFRSMRTVLQVLSTSVRAAVTAAAGEVSTRDAAMKGNIRPSNPVLVVVRKLADTSQPAN
jgi:hypothetical protein